jgi:NCS1 family nucleobase:cation symporter-1
VAAAARAAGADAALSETLPLTQAERSWSFADMLSVQSGLAIATWAFLFGGATATYVGFVDGVLAMLAGTALGVIILLVALVIPSCRSGAETFVHQRAAFGPLGAALLACVLVLIAAPGWMALLSAMIGHAAVEMLATVGAAAPAGAPVVPAVALAVLALAWLAVSRGSGALRLLNRFAAPALFALCLWLLLALLESVPLARLLGAPPINPGPERATNIMLAVELNLAGGLSWFGLAGNLGRYGRTTRATTWATLIAYVPVSVLAATVGLGSALALGTSDPVKWLVPIVRPVGGALMLLVIALANLSSIAGVAQGNAQTLVQHLGPRLQALGWPRFTLALFALAALIALAASEALYAHFYALIALTQAVLAAIAGVALAEALALRPQGVSLRALYRIEPGGDYGFWGGINPAALASVALGIAVYLALLNPLTLESAAGFNALTASLPAIAAAAGTHWLLARLVVGPAGKGGYGGGAEGRA